MPGPHQVVPVGVAERVKPVPGQHLVQHEAVKGVQGTPGQVSGDDPSERGAVAAPPVLGDGRPVGVQAGAFADLGQLGRHARPPVGQRPEHIEHRSVNVHTSHI